MNDYARRAIACVGTPFRHQGRIINVGLDCVGLIVGVYAIQELDRRDYHETPTPEHAEFLRALLAKNFARVDVDHVDNAPEGAILAFAFGARRRLAHLAIRTPVGMVHAISPRGTVETPLGEPWESRFDGAYTWRA
jgi:cell wall-associated NlpC family hydrolase